MTFKNPAPGGPGIPPRWTRGAKDAVGTAYSTSSRIWYTVANGVITECYYPTIDSPQMRDLQYLVSDGETFFHDERRNMQHGNRTAWVPRPGLQDHQYRSGRTLLHREADHRRSPPELSARPHQVQCGAGMAGAAASVRALRAPPADRRLAQQRRGAARPGDGRFLMAYRDDVYLALAGLPARSASFPVDMSASMMAGPTCRTTSTWTGSTTARWTAISP